MFFKFRTIWSKEELEVWLSSQILFCWFLSVRVWIGGAALWVGRASIFQEPLSATHNCEALPGCFLTGSEGDSQFRLQLLNPECLPRGPDPWRSLSPPHPPRRGNMIFLGFSFWIINKGELHFLGNRIGENRCCSNFGSITYIHFLVREN